MNKNVLSSACTVFLLFLFASSYAQDLDLIVTAKGDSIACRIDSISDIHIYFEMKSQNKWAHTHITHTDVTEYKRNAINEKQYKYESGTSIIKSRIQPATSIRELPRNSLYAGILSVSYARLFTGDRVGFNLAGGLNFVPALFGDAVMLMGEISLLTGGGTKHFFEPGFLIATNFDTTLIMVRAGYRYQGPDGFLFRAGILLGYDDDLSGGPALSIGYSF